MAITQPIFKLEPPDFAWQQIQIISTDDNNDDDDTDNNLSTIFYLCKTRKRSLKINRNSHRLELETPPKDYTLEHWSTQYENQFTLSFFYSGKKNKQKHRFP